MSAKTKFTDIPGFVETINEFIQKLPLAVVVINKNREIIAFNRAFFLIAGRDVRQGTRHCYEFLNFNFCQTDCLAHMASRLGRTITWDESNGTRKNGDELIVRPTVVPILNSDGEADGHVLVFQNTTDEVHLYHSFRESLDHLERRVKFLQDLNNVADQYRKIKQVDVLLASITQFPVSNLSSECCQLIQEHDDHLVIATTSSAPDCQIDSVRSEQLLDSVSEGIAILKKESTPSHVQHFNDDNPAGVRKAILLPIRSGNSDHGYLAIYKFNEPTEETAAEKPKEQLEYLELFTKSVGPYIENCDIIANLESIVDERTHELQAAQEQLMESTRLASVGEIAGMVAHEVLNPMTAILAKIRRLQGEEGGFGLMKFILEEWNNDVKDGGIDRLLENFKDVPEGGEEALIEEDLSNLRESISEVDRDMIFIEEQLHRIVGIVDNLRGLSRSQNTSDTVDVQEAINKTIELTRDGMEKFKIQLKVDFQHTSEVRCDPNELIQVIHNLTRNAMQAMDRNGVLTISTRETKKRIEIRVQDSGPGIPEEIIPKIFEMRFTTKNAQEGTGLGLNLSRRLMRQVLGDVELESAGGNGSGAVFLCWIPKEPKNGTSPK